MRVIVTPGARADMAALVDFYDAKPERRGDEMVDEFDRAVEAIRDRPRVHAPVDDDYPGIEVREFYVRRFHQRILFVIHNDEAFVFTVIHATRRAGAGHRRLDTFQ